MQTQTLTIINKLGLHARASGKFVQTAAQYQSEIWVSKGEKRINGKSIMGLMMLAAKAAKSKSKPTAQTKPKPSKP